MFLVLVLFTPKIFLRAGCWFSFFSAATFPPHSQPLLSCCRKLLQVSRYTFQEFALISVFFVHQNVQTRFFTLCYESGPHLLMLQLEWRLETSNSLLRAFQHKATSLHWTCEKSCSCGLLRAFIALLQVLDLLTWTFRFDQEFGKRFCWLLPQSCSLSFCQPHLEPQSNTDWAPTSYVINNLRYDPVFQLWLPLHQKQ